MGAILGPAFNLHAAPASLSAQPAAEDSIVSIVADAQGLPLVPPDQVPQFGTFWLGGAGGAVPLPCSPIGLPVYAIAEGQFLVADTSGEPAADSTTAAALTAQANALVNLITQIQTATARQRMRAMGMNVPPSPGGDGSGDGGDDYSPAYSPMIINSNLLWLEMVMVTNQTASLVIHPPPNDTNEVYELLYTTNLLTPATNWQWVLRSYPQATNLIVPNASDAQGFYRLRQPDDLIANDSLGTNFWTAFCGLYDDNNNELSLYISSPAGATGTVTTPGLLVNGPILVVTNCGDTTVNGTYVETSLTAQEQNDFGVTDPTGYVYGTNWVIAQGVGEWLMLAYDGGTGVYTSLYDKAGANLNGSATDWGPDPDPDWPYPTTLCAQVPLVNQFFTVAAGAVTNISIPLTVMLVDYDMVETNGIHITASAPVAVYGLDYDQFATAAFTGYPTTLLGTNYCVMAYPGYDGYSQLAIVATEDNTTVTIIPSPDADLFGPDGSYPYTNILQTGETYQVQGGNDVTGTLVTSDKPIVVLAGASLAYVQGAAGNPLVQEQLPVETWGTEALALSFAGRVNGDTYRVLAAYTNTIVLTNGVVAGTNQSGEFLEMVIDGPLVFQANQPIQVAHFANGGDYDHSETTHEGDPCEILLPPTGHCLETNIVTTGPAYIPGNGSNYPEGFDENYLNIIVVQSAITNTFVDGLTVPATNFVAIGTSGYYGAQLTLTNSGVHTVTSSQPVGVEVYGFGFYDAYGYFGGVVK